MRSLALASLLAAIIQCGAIFDFAAAQSPNVTVTVTGSGASIDSAKSDAVRQALQLTMKQLIIVDRAISGDQILRDKVMSTMNGYIERFQQQDAKRTPNGFTITAEVTVSASRIENFIGITFGGKGEFEGQSLLAEQNRRAAQLRAQQLQIQARGEIFDRLFRGFPSDALDVKFEKMRLSAKDMNIIEIDFTASFKPSFRNALDGTLRALGALACPSIPRSRESRELSVSRAFMTYSMKYGRRGCGPFEGADPDFICLGYTDNVACYELPAGQYCTSCALNSFSLDSGDPEFRRLVFFGRFVDANGQSANSQGSCLSIVAPKYFMSWRGLIPTFISRNSRFIAGFDFDRISGTIQIASSLVDLNRAKYFVAVPGLSPELEQNSITKWTTSLVPGAGRQIQGGCDLLDEAVQRQLMTLASASASRDHN